MERDYIYYEYTNSLCNKCMKVIPAKIIFKDEKVYLLKQCQKHGEQLELLEHDIEYFLLLFSRSFVVENVEYSRKRKHISHLRG